jgi:hypothetical protein
MSESDSESKHEPKVSKAVEFILKLQEDSKFLEEFNKNPDKVMIQAGISSQEHRDIIKSRDMIKIRELLYDAKAQSSQQQKRH